MACGAARKRMREKKGVARLGVYRIGIKTDKVESIAYAFSCPRTRVEVLHSCAPTVRLERVAADEVRPE
jgi:hypothetical protein